MRKAFLFGMVAAMLVTSCKEDDGLTQASGEGITFTSIIASRATDTSFETGDEIGVSMFANETFVSGAVNVQYTLTDGSVFTSQNPLTWGIVADAATADFIGVYPYKADAVSDNVYNITLSTDDGTALGENDVMYAAATGVSVGQKSVSLQFKHKLVKLVMQLYDGNGNGLSGATLKIDKQQTTGTLNLTDGTVTATGDASGTLSFAYNPEVSGQYQAIVMPSEAVQGRSLVISYQGVDYPCPIDAYTFEAGKRFSLSATINVDGTVSPGGPIQLAVSVSDWDDETVNSGWIYGEGGDYDLTGKSAYQLAANVALSSTPVVIDDFEGTLRSDDVYSLAYTRTDASDAAVISVSSQTYTLPKGQQNGTLLVPAGANTGGISVSSSDEGITLTNVSVYTSANVAMPIELWSNSNPTVGNGVADTNWPNGILNFTVSEEARKSLTLGATLNVYYTGTPSTVTFSYYNAEAGYGNSGPVVYGDGSETKHESEGYLSVTVLKPLLDAIAANNYVVGLIGSGNTITRITLLPAPANSGVNENILWMGESVQQYSKWQVVNVMLPATVSANSVLRITLRNPFGAPAGTVYGAKLVWNNDSGDNDETYVFEAENATVTPISDTDGYVDVTITPEILSALQENGMLGGGTALALLGGKKANEGQEGAYTGNSILKVELLPATAGE